MSQIYQIYIYLDVLVHRYIQKIKKNIQHSFWTKGVHKWYYEYYMGVYVAETKGEIKF
jgi:hypothetical protein